MVPRTHSSRSPRSALPRSRGDGPPRRFAAAPTIRAPPLARGWSLAAGLLEGDVERSPARAGMVLRRCGDRRSPARAGMVPRRFGSTRARSTLPRSRGDGPQARLSKTTPSCAPPLARGWSRVTLSHVQRALRSPARAGMVPWSGPRRFVTTPLPRSRGDGPTHAFFAPRCQVAPPLARGWSRISACSFIDGPRSPARAGMVPTSGRCARAPRPLPRSRGDGPGPSPRAPRRPRAPPLARGWSPHPEPGRAGLGRSPARAGMVAEDGEMLNWIVSNPLGSELGSSADRSAIAQNRKAVVALLFSASNRIGDRI